MSNIDMKTITNGITYWCATIIKNKSIHHKWTRCKIFIYVILTTFVIVSKYIKATFHYKAVFIRLVSGCCMCVFYTLVIIRYLLTNPLRHTWQGKGKFVFYIFPMLLWVLTTSKYMMYGITWN